MIDPAEAKRLQECLAGGGVAVIPTDTVYGLGCDATSSRAVERLYELKGRPAEKPAAVMFFTLHGALAALPELDAAEQNAIGTLLPAAVTLLLPNRHRRFPLACGPDPDTLGLRVPALNGPLKALKAVSLPVMQSSANLSGGSEVRRLEEVPQEILQGADLLIDGGELAGLASTVLDLRDYSEQNRWHIVREGPLGRQELKRALG